MIMEISNKKKKYKASVTVEAAISFTLTIFILILVVGPLFILKKSVVSITEMEKLNRLSCYFEEYKYHGKNLASNSEAFKKINEYIENFDDAEDYINSGYILYKLIENDIDKNNPFNNIDNLTSLNENIYDEETGIVKYDILYSFKLPLNVLSINNINQRFVVNRRAFIGANEDRFSEKEKLLEIYLARNYKVYGVYHISPTCTYLKKDLKSGNFIHISSERNENGEKYSKCGYCIKGRVDDDTIYFYTMYGHLFHKNNNCPLMTAYVSKVSNDYIEKYNLKLCVRCKKKYGNVNNEEENEIDNDGEE